MVTVAKFGGAALANPARILESARVLGQYPGDVVAVASALAGITDRLALALTEVPSKEAAVEDALVAVALPHNEALEEFGDDESRSAVDALLASLRKLLLGIAFTGEVTPRLQDHVLSHGEQLSVQVFAAAARSLGQQATAVDAARAGIHTDGPFGDARTCSDVHETIRARRNEITGTPIITGFYGVNSKGQPTSFGRGGSDYVASLVAAALKAEAVELWKDVPGFLTADPKAVPAAELVQSLDYGEAAELAYFGANVLHPRAVEPVAELGIPIRIRHLGAPDTPGTVIQANAPRSQRMVRSAASRAHLAVVRLNGPGMGHTPGVARMVFDALGDAQVNVLNMANSQATFALLIEDRQADEAKAALEPLVGGSIRSVEILRNRSLVCVVGRGLGETPGSAAKILDAVSQRNVNVEMISLGASEIAIDFIVPSEQRVDALQGLHQVFLEGP